MKSKLLIIKYADKVVLLALAALAIWSLSSIFKLAPEARPEFGVELQSAADRLQARLADPTVNLPELEQVIQEAEKLNELQESMAKPAVIPAIRRYVIHPKQPVRQPLLNVYLNEEIAAPRPIPGTNWQLKNYPEDFLQVSLQPDKSEDVTKVIFKGLMSTSDIVYNVTMVDQDGTEALFPVIVGTRPPMARPLPVTMVDLRHSLGRMVITATLQQPDEPTTPGRTGMGPAYDPMEAAGMRTTPATDRNVIRAEGIRVFRKKQDAPDTDFRQVSEDIVRPRKWTPFVEELLRLKVVRVTTAPVTRDTGGELLPDLPAGTTRRTTPVEEPEIHCLFLDRSVEPGEKYTYRIVAVSSAAPAAESEPTIRPADVPPDVEFYVTGIRPITNDVSITVRKHVYNLDRPDREPVTLEERFRSVRPGDPIGGPTSTAVVYDYWTLERKSGRESGDLFTGAYLLGITQELNVSGRVIPRRVLREGEVRRVQRADGTWEWVRDPARWVQEGVEYELRRTSPTNTALYLDKKGAIGAKYQAQPPSPTVTTPTVPGAVPPGPGAADVPDAWGPGYRPPIR